MRVPFFKEMRIGAYIFRQKLWGANAIRSC